jgi:hypothetical protein
MIIVDIPKSGRCGQYVFYMRRRKLCRRRYVIPRNVRTAARRRTRGAFGDIAKAWGERLTEEQRLAWVASGAKVKSHPRLWQSGRLTGEMHFEGINSARARIGRAMLLWPPERAVFSLNPVEGLTISSDNGRIRLRLRVSGSATEDIMVFGQAPCSAGRKKWRHGAYLGLLPAPQAGESDITDVYVQKYGEPEPGKKVFIRTRQQKDGWESRNHDFSEVVPAALLHNHTALNLPRIPRANPLISVRCTMHKGVVPEQYRSTSQATPVQCRRGIGCPRGIRAVGRLWCLGLRAEIRRKGHSRELWRGG